jgi:hypothetical protein
MRPTPTRRRFLESTAFGLGSVALTWLLNQRRASAAPATARPEVAPQHFDLLPKPSPAPARARAMISLFMQGGPSQIDLLDPKPALNKLDGQKFPGEVKYDNAAQASSRVLGCPWQFKKCGQSGTEISEILPHLQRIADDVTLVRSMQTGVNNHGESIYAMHGGKPEAGRPTLGSWLAYGLGCETQDLPAYVALADPAGLPVTGTDNWSAGWLPGLFQGTLIRSKEPRVPNLDVPAHLRGAGQRNYLDFLGELNREHLARHPGELELEARIATFELAARMQVAAKEALDITGESEATKRLYGLDNPVTAEFGTRCLIARRLVERGVRFVSVFTETQAWDHHGGIRKGLPRTCAKVDLPSAALVIDLKSRGLLDSTVVHWGGEMGRLPVVQNDGGPDKAGRDHNTYGFSMWLAGGGFKPGIAYGQTDEFGHKAVADVVTHRDYHATLLHLFGLDAAKLTYPRNNRDQSLTDGQPARVVREILA